LIPCRKAGRNCADVFHRPFQDEFLPADFPATSWLANFQCSFGAKKVRQKLFAEIKSNINMKGLLASIIGVIFAGYKLSWLRLHSGDFAAFLTQEIARFGGRALSSEPPPLMAQWRHQSDDNGFTIGMPEADFSEVAALLEKTYGSVPITTSARGTPHGLYKPRDFGLYLRFFSEDGGVGIICSKGKPQRP
jgi:hypothetical protein